MVEILLATGLRRNSDEMEAFVVVAAKGAKMGERKKN